MLNKIILASKSEVRKQILDKNNIKCIVKPSNVDEDTIKENLLKQSATPEIISKNLAELKANKVSLKNPNYLVLGADSVIDLDNELISKPESREEAMSILKKLNGKTHHLISSVCISINGSMIWNYTDKASLNMKNLSNDELEKYIKCLSEESGCSKILVIGGGGNQKGSITSSIEILETDLLSKYNFEEVGLAGHPEGNPDVKQVDLDNAIIQKNLFSKKTDFKMYLATQFFFEARSLKEWELHLNSLDNNLEIHAGIPGPASLKTLLSYATSCGIGISIRFLSKQALNITKLATTRSPDKLIYDLASYQIENPKTKLKKIHFYAFGGIKKTSDWLKTVNKPDLIYNGQKFE